MQKEGYSLEVMILSRECYCIYYTPLWSGFQSCARKRSVMDSDFQSCHLMYLGKRGSCQNSRSGCAIGGEEMEGVHRVLAILYIVAVATCSRSAARLSARNCNILTFGTVSPILKAVAFSERLSRKRQVRTSRYRSGSA